MRIRDRGAMLLLAALGACASAPPPERPAPLGPVPDHWRSAPDAASTAPGADAGWWMGFRDPQLQALMQRALAEAPDLRIARAHLLAAHDAVQVARSYEYPSLIFKAGPTDPAIPRLARDSGHARASDDHFELGLQASYELDFWGRVSGTVAAARADADASAFDAEAARLALQSAVANAYFDLREADEALRLQTRHEALADERARLLQLRLDAGRIAAAPMVEARLAQQDAQARGAELRARRQLALLELQTLLGDTAESLQLAPAELRATLSAPEVPAGLPSSLLERRPDLRAAEARLAAAQAGIAVARAERLPDVSLTADFGYLSGALSHLAHGGGLLFGIGPEISWPLFDAGRGAAQVDARKQEYEAARAGYQKDVIAAFADVEKALLARQAAMESAQRWAAAQALESAQLERLRAALAAGRADRLQAIETEEHLLQADEAALHAYRAQLDSLVALYQALGGDWQQAAPTTAPAADIPGPDRGAQ